MEVVMSDQCVLRTRKLSKNFSSVQALDQVSIHVYEGEVYGFLGPNGAGKTTTIGIMLGLIHATSGQVEIFQEKVRPNQTTVLQRVGSLMGSPSFVPYLTGRDNLRILAQLHSAVNSNRIDKLLGQVGLAGAANRKAKGYSSGMKQRLALAGALLHKPEMLILDEPTNGLDPAGMREVRLLLRSLADGGTTIFLSSHLLHEVEQICDRVAVLNHGKVVAEGTVSELRGDHQVVRVRVPNLEMAALLLNPLARSVRKNGVYLEVEGLLSEAVVETLALNGMMPSEVSIKGHDLEQVFLDLTRDSA
jgi:ABC-type multidrug transport system ATPase subunit